MHIFYMYCSRSCLLSSVALLLYLFLFFFNHTATTEIYTLSLHDALPISRLPRKRPGARRLGAPGHRRGARRDDARSEEHTSELQSPDHLVCRLLLEKKKKSTTQTQEQSTDRPTLTSPTLSPDETQRIRSH